MHKPHRFALALLLSLTSARSAVADTTDPALDARERQLTEFVAQSYDDRRGFVTKEGAPNESAIELAWRLAGEGQAPWRDRARRSVEWTWSLYDSIGGGLLEGEKDARHDVASFDKRTDSNAWRLENRVDAWLDARRAAAGGSVPAGRGSDAHAIRQILDFFDRVLLDPRGGFVAGQVGDRDLVPEANGPAIHAYLTWAAASGETHWRDFAWKSLDRVVAASWNAQFGFLRMGMMGEVISVPRLDDQVEMGRAFALAAHVGGRERDLTHARAIGDLLLERFEDRKQGGMRVQVALNKDGKTKNAARDPEPNARAARFLTELATVAGDARYRDAARRLIDVYMPDRRKPAEDDADWVLAIRGLRGAEFPARTEWKAPPSAPTPKPQVTRITRSKRR